MNIEHQDKQIIIVNAYQFTGLPDYYIKVVTRVWDYSTVGNPYKLLLDRRNRTIIEINNEFYQLKYSGIESLLTGDVLILGMGLAILDSYLVTGSTWKWVEKNEWLCANVIPASGTLHNGNAEDMVFLSGLGTFDTILIDFPQTQLNDYSSLLNMGGTIIEMTI